MKQPYLEVTYRCGRPLAAYLYLPRKAEDKSVRTTKAEPGMIIDYEKNGRAIGIEIAAPTIVTVSDLNRVLTEIGAHPISQDDLAPLKAA
ncbi:MAG: DUF2283 domain-containing protein [Thiohalocapsa sp. PB-PSB1]|jgi:uncharacterized protein YuzE|nr:MAG: DUF2283 domain-containing protein [Thiohalocapsa sp. PB-PSB1]